MFKNFAASQKRPKGGTTQLTYLSTSRQKGLTRHIRNRKWYF